MDDSNSLRVAVLGNVDPAVWWSTEWEYVDAWQRNGHHVDRYLEQDVNDWDRLIVDVRNGRFDLVHWTSTHDFAVRAGETRQWKLSQVCHSKQVPLIGVHLDTWINLEREHRVFDVPYFQAVHVLFTADGDADRLWEAADIKHRWLMPAVNERYCYIAAPDRSRFDCDVVFVGGWDGYGHKMWRHRSELIEYVSRWYGDRFLALPRRNAPRIIGDELNTIYSTAKVVIGDSCLVPHPDGRPKHSYCSDRIPETLGRGGVLVHPHVEHVTDVFCVPEVWQLGDWDVLKSIVDGLLGCEPDELLTVRRRNVEWILQHHTYTNRVQEIVASLNEMRMLR